MAKYLKKFDTTAEYQAYITDLSVPKPNVCWCVDENSVYYNPLQPNNEIWYTSSDGNIVNPFNSSAFGANIVSNTYEGGKGIIKFDGIVTTINYEAFLQTSLLSISIPNSVTNIGSEAFESCNSLTGVTIPDSVISIGYMAFNQCFGLTNITIPNSVVSIGDYAFYICLSLTSITIPDSVESIGESAFNLCLNLTSITIESTTPATLGSGAFNDTNNCPIYVPAESVDAYKAAEGWSEYAARIQAMP